MDQSIAPSPVGHGTMRACAARWYPLLALALVLVASAMARGWTSYDQVFTDSGEVRLLGVDPYFHLRHSQHILQDFPTIKRWDDKTHFPSGTKNDAAGLFNILVASVTLTFYGSEATIDELASVSAWVAFILGSLCTVLLFVLSQNLLGNGPAVMAVVFFTLFPGTFADRALLGFADQHVAEVCLALTITLALVKLLGRCHVPRRHSLVTPSLLAAIPLLLLAYTWRGAVIYLPIIAVCLLVYLTLAMYQNKDPKPIKLVLSVFSATTFGTFLLVHYLWPWLEMSPQGTRWLIFGVAGLAISGWFYLTLLERVKPALRANVALVGLVVVSVSIAIIMLATPVGQSIGTMLFEQRTLMVREHQHVDLTQWIWQLGLPGLLVLFGAIGGIIMVVRQQLPLTIVIPIIMGGLWLLIWWQTGDFGYLAPPFSAFIAAMTIAYLLPFSAPISMGLALTCSLALLFGPFDMTRPPWLNKAQVKTLKIYPEGWFNAVNWLREHSPLVERYNEKPNYGVISAWDFGNIIASYGDRIPVWSRYPSHTIHRWLTAQSEVGSFKWLCQACEPGQSIKYAMVDADSFGPFFAAKAAMAGLPLGLRQQGELTVKQATIPKMKFNQYYPGAMISKLFAADGQELEHFRLIYETPQSHFVTSHLENRGNQFDYKRLALPVENDQLRQQYQQFAASDVVVADSGYLYDGAIYPSVKIFEIVPGAKVAGKAAAGTIIRAQLKLQVTSSKRQFSYTNTVTADSQGRYIMTVPYPTGSEQGDVEVRALSAYQLFIKAPGAEKFKLHGEFNVGLKQIYR